MKCTGCNHVNTRDARFCEVCGAPLGVAESPSAASWWIIPLIVIIVGVAVTAILMLNQKSAEREAESTGASPGEQTTPRHSAERPTLVSSDQPLATIEGFAPLTVRLKPVSFEHALEEGALTYVWEFAPGRREFSKETGGRAVFTYSEPGLYNAKLTVSDESGDIARQTWEVVVLPGSARDIPLAYQAEPRSAAANVAMARMYLSINSQHSGAYYAMRAFLSDPKNPNAITTLADALESFPRFDEYLHFVLIAGTRESSIQSAFQKKLEEKTALWKDTLNKRRSELNSTAGRPSKTVVSNYLQALAAMRNYAEAAKLVGDNQLTENQLDNLAWYSLNIGKIKEAGGYASRWLAAHPNDPYGLEYMMLSSALDNRYEDARKYLRKYAAINPQRGHAISVLMDVIIFTESGLNTDFAWEVADALRVFI